MNSSNLFIANMKHRGEEAKHSSESGGERKMSNE